jgi:type IX secretion system substrate protein
LNYQWFNQTGDITGATTTEYTAAETGNYGVRISNEDDCEYIPQTIPVIAAETPPQQQMQVQGNTTVCPGEEVVLSVAYNDDYTYQWNLNGIEIYNATSNSYDVTEEGNYLVEISNYDCSISTNPIEIIYKSGLPKPELVAQGPDIWILACSNDSAQIYRWYYNSEAITGASEPIYIANQNLGEYYVTINDGGDCFVASDIVNIPLGAVGIDEMGVFGEIKIYPNPTPGTFTIEMNNQIIGTLYIRITNVTGRELFNIKHNKTNQHFQTQMDLSGQGRGMYFIEFRFEEDKTVRKLVVE